MKLMEEIKSHSSAWIKPKDDRLKNFYWQDGYGAFSVSPSEVDTVIAYIENQHKHTDSEGSEVLRRGYFTKRVDIVKHLNEDFLKNLATFKREEIVCLICGENYAFENCQD